MQRNRFSPLVVAGGLFVVWVSLSTLWRSVPDPLTSGDLLTGDFAVEATALRVIAMAAAIICLSWASLSIKPETARRVTSLIMVGIAFHAVILAIQYLFTDQLLALFAPYSDPVKEAPQNLIRNVNLFSLALPLFLAPLLLTAHLSVLRISGLIAAYGFLLAIAVKFGSQTVFLALCVGGLAWAVLEAFKRNGFRLLFLVSAVYVLAMPLLVKGIYVLRRFLPGLDLPLSFEQRLWCWQLVNDKLAARPFLGHGINAAEGWRETFAAYPEWLEGQAESWKDVPVIPGHVHNMALEIWAETGLVGAFLAATVLVGTGFALPRPQDLALPARFAIAGVFGAAIAQFSVTYSMWNDAYWGSVGLAVAGCFALAKTTSN